MNRTNAHENINKFRFHNYLKQKVQLPKKYINNQKRKRDSRITRGNSKKTGNQYQI